MPHTKIKAGSRKSSKRIRFYHSIFFNLALAIGVLNVIFGLGAASQMERYYENEFTNRALQNNSLVINLVRSQLERQVWLGIFDEIWGSLKKLSGLRYVEGVCLIRAAPFEGRKNRTVWASSREDSNLQQFCVEEQMRNGFALDQTKYDILSTHIKNYVADDGEIMARLYVIHDLEKMHAEARSSIIPLAVSLVAGYITTLFAVWLLIYIYLRALTRLPAQIFKIINDPELMDSERLSKTLTLLREQPARRSFREISEFQESIGGMANMVELLMNERQQRIVLADNELVSQNIKLYRSSQKLKTAYEQLEMLNSAIYHEFGSAVRYLLFEIKELREQAEKSAHALPSINSVTELVEGLSRMIVNIKYISEINYRHFQIQEVDLHNLSMHIWGEASRLRPELNDFRLDIDQDVVYADPYLLELAMSHLIDNAIKYSEELPKRQLKITLKNEKDRQIIAVMDSGIGFDMTYKDKMFEPLQRLHNETFQGSGLGLYIVKIIAERHQGCAWAQSPVFDESGNEIAETGIFMELRRPEFYQTDID